MSAELSLVHGKFPDFSERQINAICEVYMSAVKSERSYLAFDCAFVKKMMMEFNQTKKTEMMAILFDIFDELEMEDPQREPGLLLRRLVFFAIFGAQVFTRSKTDISMLAETIDNLSKIDGIRSLKIVGDIVVTSLEPFVQGMVKGIPSFLIESVLNALKSFSVIFSVNSLFTFFVKASGDFEGDINSGVFEEMMAKIKEMLPTAPTELFLELVNNLLDLLMCSKRNLHYHLMFAIFEVVIDMMRIDGNVSEFMTDAKNFPYVLRYMELVIVQMDFEKMEMRESVSANKLAEMKPCTGPIERTLERDYQRLTSEMRPKKLSGIKRPNLPTRAKNKDINHLLETIHSWSGGLQQEVYVIMELVKSFSVEHRAPVPYFFCSWIEQADYDKADDFVPAFYETKVLSLLVDYAYNILDDSELKDYVKGLILRLVSRCFRQEPLFLGEFLTFIHKQCQTMQLTSELRECVVNCAQVSTNSFTKGCQLVGWSYKMTQVLEALSGAPESETKLEVLRMIDEINSFHLIFQEMGKFVEFGQVILLYFYDPSTWYFALSQVGFAFEQFRAESPVLHTIIRALYVLALDEKQFLEILDVIKAALTVNEREMNALFNRTRDAEASLIDVLLYRAKSFESRAITTELISICSSISVSFDISSKLEVLFPQIDEEMITQLWNIVFDDDLGTSSPRKFVNPAPLPFLFRIMQKKNDDFESFIDFISRCIEVHPDSAYAIAALPFPAQLLEYMFTFRNLPNVNDLFRKVLNLFETISLTAVKPSDLISLFRLCTSLPGHERPCFTTDIISVMSKLYGESVGVSDFFYLAGDNDHIQLPQLSALVINQEWAIVFDVKFLKEVNGVFLEFSKTGTSEQLTVNYENGNFIVKQSTIDQEGVPLTETVSAPVKLSLNEWVRIAIVFTETEVRFIAKNQDISRGFSKKPFQSDLSHYQAIRDIECHVASLLMVQTPTSEEMKLLMSIHPRLTSFHPSELEVFGANFAPLFTPEFQSKLVLILNACVTEGKNAINLVGPTTADVTGLMFHATPSPIDILGSIGSITTFLPLLGQLHQPIRTESGSSEFVFNEQLLPSILNVLTVVLKTSEMQQNLFNQMHGFAMMGFLLSLSGNQYMTEMTIAAICSMFKSLRYPSSRLLMDEVMWNLHIWLPTAAEFQLKAYSSFWQAMKEKCRENQKELILLRSFNVTKILSLIRVFLWDRMTNKRMCIDVNWENARGPGASRPTTLRRIRRFFWQVAQEFASWSMRDADMQFILRCCCDAEDLDINREMLQFFIRLLRNKNEFICKFLVREHKFSDFFSLLSCRDSQVLSYVVEIFVLMITTDKEMLKPYSISEWVAGMMNTIVSESITEKFVENLYRCMIGNSQTEDGQTSPHIQYPELIPLFLQSILQLETPLLERYFGILSNCLKSDEKVLQDVPFFDHAFLLFLFQQIPNEDTPISNVAAQCLDLLAFIYHQLLANDTHEQERRSIAGFITMLSSRLNRNYAHITRILFNELLTCKYMSEGWKSVLPDNLVSLYEMTVRFITEIPSIDLQHYRCIEIENPETAAPEEPLTFQKLFHVLIRSDIPGVDFVFATRTSQNGNWADAELAENVVIRVLGQAEHLCGPKLKKPAPIGFMVTELVNIGLLHRNYTERFLKYIPEIISFFSKLQHQKAAITSALGGMIRALMQQNPCPDLPGILVQACKDLRSYMRQHAKITIPKDVNPNSVSDSFEALSPIVEATVKYEDQFSKSEMKLTGEAYDRMTRTIVDRDSRFASQIESYVDVDARKAREMSALDKLHVSLEQRASMSRYNFAEAAKNYKQIFYTLSTDNGPWQAPEYVPELHRKLSPVVLGNNLRFQMKRNLAFSDHREASSARDASGPDNGPEQFQKQLAKRKMTEFLGDFALVAAVSTEKSEQYISDQVVLQCDARYITMETVHSGTLSLTKSAICFDSPGKYLSISINLVTSVYHRLCLLTDSAVEIFTAAKKSFFIDFSEDQRKLFLRKLAGLKPARLKFIQMKREDIDPLVQKTMSRWQKGQLSNFKLLMRLNKYAGRSYNDLSQYPVFPWVIADYRSEKLDLNSVETFRDLSKPIAAMSEARLSQLKEQYIFCKEVNAEEAFLYGAFYSSEAAVIGYLIRMEPFTTLHVKLQSGKFDHADRLFVSIPSAWESVTHVSMDYRELIPEFFYFPDFLLNENKNDFGILTRTKKRVGDVELPPWAKSARDFVVMNRIALESSCVTARLHLWLDLIFGPKSRGAEAEAVDNVFHPHFYEEALIGADPAKVTLIKEYAACFGTAPRLLFKETPPQQAIAPCRFRDSIFAAVAEHVDKIFDNDSPIVAIFHDKQKSVMRLVNNRFQYAEVTELHASFTCNVGRLALDIPSEFDDVAESGSLIAIDANHAVVAVPWDSAFFVFEWADTSKPKYICRTHSERVSALSVLRDTFVTGARDRSFCVWKTGKKSLVNLSSILKHKTAVSLVDINHKLRMCVAVSQGGYLTSASTVDGNYLNGKDTGVMDPNHVVISDFGSIILGSNIFGTGKCVIKVFDQNLLDICEVEIPGIVKCWKCVSWNDGAEYLIVGFANRKLALYKLPFVEELEFDMRIGATPVAMEVICGDSPVIVVSDDKGEIWLVKPPLSRVDV